MASPYKGTKNQTISVQSKYILGEGLVLALVYFSYTHSSVHYHDFPLLPTFHP